MKKTKRPSKTGKGGCPSSRFLLVDWPRRKGGVYALFSLFFSSSSSSSPRKYIFFIKKKKKHYYSRVAGFLVSLAPRSLSQPVSQIYHIRAHIRYLRFPHCENLTHAYRRRRYGFLEGRKPARLCSLMMMLM